MTNAPEVMSSSSSSTSANANAGPSTSKAKPLIKPYPFLSTPTPSKVDRETAVRGLKEVLADSTAVVLGQDDPK